jgi:hypothetical protein
MKCYIDILYIFSMHVPASNNYILLVVQIMILISKFNQIYGIMDKIQMKLET